MLYDDTQYLLYYNLPSFLHSFIHYSDVLDPMKPPPLPLLPPSPPLVSPDVALDDVVPDGMYWEELEDSSLTLLLFFR